MAVSLQDIARIAGVSVKTVSGALHGGQARMADDTRQRICELAEKMGYVTNLAARSMRQGWMPLIGLIADELLTSPSATEIMRGIDNTARQSQISVFSISLGSSPDVLKTFEDIRRFRPRAIGYAAMYHKVVELPEALTDGIGVMINCRDKANNVASLVPDEEAAGQTIVNYLIEHGRRRIAFINLPGLLAGQLRAAGVRRALADAGIDPASVPELPAVRRAIYNDRASSLVDQHVRELMAGPNRPDAILCGNDRVAMEVYAALHRLGIVIPDDVAVASFDNQVDIATRLDPPLTTMALPHRALGRMAAEILLADSPPVRGLKLLPFQLVERASV